MGIGKKKKKKKKRQGISCEYWRRHLMKKLTVKLIASYCCQNVKVYAWRRLRL